MRRFVASIAAAALLTIGLVGTASAKPEATYDVVMTRDGCSWTFEVSWTRVRVSQVQLETFENGGGGVFVGPGTHQPGKGQFKNYGNNAVIRWSIPDQGQTKSWSFAVYFFAEDNSILHRWESDPEVVQCG